MSGHPILTDALVERMLAGRAGDGAPWGLAEAVGAQVAATPQVRRNWWARDVAPRPQSSALRLAWIAALVGLLLAATAATAATALIAGALLRQPDNLSVVPPPPSAPPSPATVAPSATPVVTVRPGAVAPAPTEIVAGLWAPATSADTELADELNRVWTEHDVDALDRIYAADFMLVKGWELANSDNLDTVRATVADVPYTYQRLSPVTVTTDAAVGLPPLPDGWRYLHWVVLINGDWFDGVNAVDEGGLIHVSYIDDYQKAWWRLTNGFPVFSSLLESPNPS